MSASLSFALASYFTFSIVIAFYAFSYFRKTNGVAFSLVGAFALMFFWWIPALRWCASLIKRGRNAKNN
jgi:intracellular septation protein A